MNYSHIAQLGRQAAMKQAADPIYDYLRNLDPSTGDMGRRSARLEDDRDLDSPNNSLMLDQSTVSDYLRNRDRAAEETTYLQGENANLQGDNANLQGDNESYGLENQQLSKWLTNPRFWGGAAVGAGGLAAAYGGKKLYDWFNEDDEEEQKGSQDPRKLF